MPIFQQKLEFRMEKKQEISWVGSPILLQKLEFCYFRVMAGEPPAQDVRARSRARRAKSNDTNFVVNYNK